MTNRRQNTLSPPEPGIIYDIGLKLLCPASGRDTLFRRLKEPQLLLKHWGKLYPVLYTMLGSPQRAAMTMYAIRTQALRGICFRSARNIAGNGAPGSSEKTWDRCLKFLSSRGLVQVTRLIKGDGKHSVNLIDFSALWDILRELIVHSVGTARRFGGELWRKIGGIWLNRAMMMPQVILKLPHQVAPPR